MSAQITVNVAGNERSVAEGTTAADLFGADRTVRDANGMTPHDLAVHYRLPEIAALPSSP